MHRRLGNSTENQRARTPRFSDDADVDGAEKRRSDIAERTEARAPFEDRRAIEVERDGGARIARLRNGSWR